MAEKWNKVEHQHQRGSRCQPEPGKHHRMRGPSLMVKCSLVRLYGNISGCRFMDRRGGKESEQFQGLNIAGRVGRISYESAEL